MKRSVAVLVATLLLGGLGVAPALAQKIKPVGPGTATFTTPDGTNFRFGISLDYTPQFLDNFDFNDNTNFRNITGFGAFGDEDSVISFEHRLFFTVTKGRLSLYSAIELDGALDEREIDHNNPNVERLNISLLVPEVSTTFTVGADIYILDSFGRMVYLDDDPGVWFRGGAGPWSWQAGWHKRQEFGGTAGDSGGRKTSRVGVFETREDDTNLFSGKVGYDVKHANGRFKVEPFFLAYLRASPYTGAENFRLPVTGPGGVTRPADPLQASLANIQPNQASYYLGFGGGGNFGIIRPTVQFAYLTGHVEGLVDRPAGNTLPFGHDDFDINSYASYARLDFDVSKQPWWPFRGVIPFVDFEMVSGDDDPSDDDLEGFVAVSMPNGLRRGDIMFLYKNVLNYGSPVLGNGTAAFGFNTDGHGIGPTIGGIFENASPAPSSVTFINRAGKGDNPGFLRFGGGLSGRWNTEWAFHLRGEWLRFHETEPIEAEYQAFSNISSVSSEIGTQVTGVVVWEPHPRYQVRPFLSLLFPGDGAQDLANGGDETAVFSGINWFAIF